MARTRHVIVGGGTAGINAITTIRQYDRGASEVILVSAERPYARMVLPYYLKGSISESHVYTLNPTRLHTLAVEAYLGRRAAQLVAESPTLEPIVFEDITPPREIPRSFAVYRLHSDEDGAYLNVLRTVFRYSRRASQAFSPSNLEPVLSNLRLE